MTEAKPTPSLWCQTLPACIAWDLRKLLAANFEKISISYMEVNTKSLLISLQKRWGLMAWKKKDDRRSYSTWQVGTLQSKYVSFCLAKCQITD